MEGKTQLKEVMARVLIQDWEACVQHPASFIHCSKGLQTRSFVFLHVVCLCGLKPELSGHSCGGDAFLVLQSSCDVLMVLYCAGRAVPCAASVTWLLPHVHEPRSQSKAIVGLHSPSVHGDSPALFLKSGKVFCHSSFYFLTVIDGVHTELVHCMGQIKVGKASAKQAASHCVTCCRI